MIFLKLFFTFFKIGLFGFGGGYGMLSLIQSETVTHNAWMTSAEFANIVAISQMTPGPIGINAATYCGSCTECCHGRDNGCAGQRHCHPGTGTTVVHSDDSDLSVVHEIHELNGGAKHHVGSAPGCSGAYCRRRIAVNEQREFLGTVNKPLVFRHQPLYFRSYTHWYNGVKDQPYTNDMLGSVCRTDAVVLN